MSPKEDKMNSRANKIVFCTPALYSTGGVERVVSYKASFFAEQLGYDVTIIVTEGDVYNFHTLCNCLFYLI